MADSPRARRRVVEAPARRSRPALERIRVVVEPDPDPDISYLEQDEFKERLRAYKRDEFGFVGVRAEADVIIEGTVQTLTSAGLWGIESDSERSYLEEVAAEEYRSLRDVLKAVGVATADLPQEADKGWIEWRA
jgi:hypothetical protein